MGAIAFKLNDNLKKINCGTNNSSDYQKNDLYFLKYFQIFCLVLIILSGILFSDSQYKNTTYIVLFIVICTAILIIGNNNSSLSYKILSNKILVLIGLISYPLYLTHWVYLSFANHIFISLSEPQLYLAKLLLIFISFVSAYLLYKFIELPIRKSNKNAIVILIILMVLIFIFGNNIIQNKGYQERIPGEIRGLVSYQNYISDWEKDVRLNTCHLGGDIGIKNRLELCVEKKRPLILIWGDSHAASLYPGMKLYSDSINFGLAQFTGSSQMPIWTSNTQLTNQNIQILDIINKIKPNVVILHAKWTDYLNLEELVSKIRETSRKIKEVSPNSKIIIIGPVVKWKDTIQNCIMHFFFYKSLHMIPETRMKVFIDQKVIKYDEELKRNFTDSGLQYISAYSAMCNNDGCIYRNGYLPENLFFIDTAHLSKKGSEFLINEIKSNFLIK